MYVCMYLYAQIAQCNTILVYVYQKTLAQYDPMLACVYPSACATIAQFNGQTVPSGTVRVKKSIIRPHLLLASQSFQPVDESAYAEYHSKAHTLLTRYSDNGRYCSPSSPVRALERCRPIKSYIGQNKVLSAISL